MRWLLLDTNVLVYLSSSSSPLHLAARDAVRQLAEDAAGLALTGQNLLEFYTVATRSTADRGLGMSPAEAREQARRFASRLCVLDDRSVDWLGVLDLAVDENVRGRRVHDARLVAVMREHGLTEILSFDRGMDGFAGITRVEPPA